MLGFFSVIREIITWFRNTSVDSIAYRSHSHSQSCVRIYNELIAGCFNFLKVKEVCSSRGKSLHVTVVITNWFRSDRPQRVELILSFALNSNVKFHFVTVLRFTVLLHFPESIKDPNIYQIGILMLKLIKHNSNRAVHSTENSHDAILII